MFNISLEQGGHVTTMLAIAAVAILLAAAFYQRAFGALRRWQWLTLLALRIAAISLIVLLLFRPVLSYHRELKERKALIFLLDNSASMSISDDATGVTRFNQARRQIQSWWEKLRRDFDLYLITFSERARPLLGDVDEQLQALSPDGKATSLSRALVCGARLRGPGDRPLKVEAILLLSDGVHNSARNPLDVAAKMPATVHTVGVGASLRSDVSYRDIQVTGIDCPDRLMLNNIAKISASVEGVGLVGRVVQVILQEDGQQVGQAELTLDGVEGPQQVTFEYRPTSKGRHTYVVQVPVVSEEKIQQNNRRSAVAMVVEPGIRVLYVEGTLRAEYGALVQHFLAKDPDLEFCALVQTSPNVFVQRSNIEGLKLTAIPHDQQTIDTFDVFIFGDLDSTYIRPAEQELLVRRVRDGAGLLMLGGYHSLGPGGYAGTPLGETLPLRLGGREVGQVLEPFLPTLTPDGTHHPIFANISGFFPTGQGGPTIAGLPLLDGCTRVEAARPGATVLATLGGQSPAMPVLAVQPVDRGRTAVFAADTTRNWQQGPLVAGQQSPFLQFWGQMVRWLAGRSVAVETEASIVGSTDKASYEPEEPIRLSAVVRDQKGEGTNKAKVVATLRGPGARPAQIELNTVAGPAGHYSGSFEPETPGNYEITITATLPQTKLSTDKMTVEVGRPSLEFEKLDLNEKLLGEIAADTGGRYFHVTTADYLIEQLDRTQQKTRQDLNVKLYRPLPFWILFVGVLTTEWILRRRFQLR